MSPSSEPRPGSLGRFRSLRWRLTFLYLGLLAVLLTLFGTAQYFAAREVLFRSTAEVLRGEYAAVLTAFRREQTVTGGTARLRQFANELRSRRISATIIGPNGGEVFSAPATLPPNQVPFLPLDQYLAALRGSPHVYYLASDSTGSSYLLVLNPIKSGQRTVGLAQLSTPTNDIERTLRLDRLLALIGSVSVLLLALLLSPLIIGRALVPLAQVATSARAIARGDYRQRVRDPQTNDEIGELAGAFNHMAASVEKAIKVREESESQMRQFLADASHELRTPLTSLSGYVDVLLRREAVDLPTLQEALGAMRRESARMTMLLNDLLALARYQSATPVRQSVALDVLLKQTLDEIDLPARGSGDHRDFATGLTVEGDPEALKRVILNLAQNALKYAPGDQHWSLFAEGQFAVIRVQDNGPGISAEDLPHVFDRFYRGQKARDRETGGSGLGLAIVKSIVETHQGTVEAASRAGQGATFTIRLPLARRLVEPPASAEPVS